MRKKISFGKFVYGSGTANGEMLGLDPIIDEGTYTANFGHIWKGTYAELGTGKEGKYKHVCLTSGIWCWSNALTNPLMAFHFIIWKLKNHDKKR